MIVPKPVPVPDALSAGFWDAAGRYVLAMQRCRNCGWLAYPPNIICTSCLSQEAVFDWTPVSGHGRITSWTVIHQAFLPGFAEDVPYTVVQVELREQPGLRIVGRLMGDPPTELRVGLPVSVTFEDVADGLAVPGFVVAEEVR